MVVFICTVAFLQCKPWNCFLFTTLIPVYVSQSAFPVEFSFWHVNIFLNSQDTGTYLALATSRVSLKRKRCLSWVCRPVFSCAWAWPKNRRAGHSARKAWTRGHDSGLTGVRQLSLRTEKNKTIGHWLILDKHEETISSEINILHLAANCPSCLCFLCCQSMPLMDRWKQRRDFQEEKEVVWVHYPFLFTLNCQIKGPDLLLHTNKCIVHRSLSCLLSPLSHARARPPHHAFSIFYGETQSTQTHKAPRTRAKHQRISSFKIFPGTLHKRLVM